MSSFQLLVARIYNSLLDDIVSAESLSSTFPDVWFYIL